MTEKKLPLKWPIYRDKTLSHPVKCLTQGKLFLFFPFDVNRPIQFAYQPAAAAGTFWLIEGILDNGDLAFQGGWNVISGVLIVFHRELLFPDPER